MKGEKWFEYSISKMLMFENWKNSYRYKNHWEVISNGNDDTSVSFFFLLFCETLVVLSKKKIYNAPESYKSNRGKFLDARDNTRERDSSLSIAHLSIRTRCQNARRQFRWSWTRVKVLIACENWDFLPTSKGRERERKRKVQRRYLQVSSFIRVAIAMLIPIALNVVYILFIITTMRDAK